MNEAFKIKEIKPNIFLFEFKNHYDMCMHFLRYQEYYESSSPQFRGKAFTIFDFMRWYAIKFGKGSFTYTNDWNGFNIPGNIIWDIVNQHLIPDRNHYDVAMYNAWKTCYHKAGSFNFYIIGVVKGNGALDHEIAHGFFYLYPEYKKDTTKLVKSLKPSLRKEINATLKRLGYTPKVYIDEAQAYLSTGLTEGFVKLDQEHKPFQAYFKKFLKDMK